MVRGEIMNCVHPMVRGGEVVGYTWANETLEDIYRQISQGAQRIFFSPNIQPILGLTGLLLFCSQALLLSRSPAGQLTWAALQMQKYLKTSNQAIARPGKCGFTIVPKENMPQKVCKECINCHDFPKCEEVAVIKDI
ncbi:hypothetical protein SAMN05660649_03371 [Desulfotomaculum arcticum]|uniref:Uncharacterized protein n=2 Tax=Desulfotruncus TaxID=2867377 RepID=A0A1I2W9L6_9FIRM|nr:hypothetical protein SAMN05660649_03371 [Desulfotomaculum arcticum] [Desulfotruncus arcticus DSM 17038]